MADNSILPKAQSQLVDAGGRPTRAFYAFFNALVSRFQGQIDTINALVSKLAAVIKALGGDVDDMPDIPALIDSKADKTINVLGTGSIAGGGNLFGDVYLRLAGDTDDAPAPLSFYGVLSDDGRGWQTYSANFYALDNGDGTLSLDLADLADSGTGAALVKLTRDAKGRISGTSAATTTDLTEGSNLYYTDARSDARITLQKAQPSGLATLDAAGKLDAGQLPALAITETFVVNTQAAMLALSAQEGDVAVRTDLSKSFILTAAQASTLANWQELLTPTSPVTSVFGRVGSVTAATGDYTPEQVGAEPAIPAGTAAQYWRGDKTWRDFATDVRAAVLTGLSTATSAVVAATDTVLQAFGKLQAQITDNLLPPGYIDGLQMQWVSGTAITVTSGAAYIVGGAKVLRATADIAKTGLSLSASTWYHVYLYDNAGTPDVELSTTAPAAAYNGTARTKTGDTSRRYVGSVKTNAASSILNFGQIGAYIAYRNFQGGSPFRVLANGTALTETSVSLSGCVPSTSTLAMVRVINTAGTGNADAQVYTGTSNDSAAGPPTSGIITVDPSKDGYVMHPLDDSQAMTYWYRAAGVGGGGAYMDVYGYAFER